MLTPFMEMLTSDSSLLPAITRMKLTPGEYLYQHSLNVALLSMSAAARLGVRKEILLEIGMGAFLQDVGMLEMPEEIRMAPRPLTPEERMLVAEHPHYTLDYLQGIEGLGSISLVICYQAHERANGAGYPHNRPRREIHPYARLVSAADVYTAISSHRPYRPAQAPYEAIVTVLRETGSNLFDRDVIRNLLDCISLFPIGSYVRLSNGQYAKVLRANADQHTKPVIVPLNADGSECDYEIDLARTNYATIVAALPSVGPQADATESL